MIRNELLRILGESPRPMTAREILTAEGRDEITFASICNLNQQLYRLEESGLVRRAGMTRGKRNVPCILWRAVE